MGVILPSGDTWQCPHVILVVTTGEGCSWHLVGRGHGAAKRPTRHQDRDPDEGSDLRKGSMVRSLRNGDHVFLQLQHSIQILNYFLQTQCDTNRTSSIHSLEIYRGPTVCQDCVSPGDTETETRRLPTRSLYSHRTVETSCSASP